MQSFKKWQEIINLVNIYACEFLYSLYILHYRYSKVNKDDNAGHHQLEIGWVKVTNLLPNTLYKVFYFYA